MSTGDEAVTLPRRNPLEAGIVIVACVAYPSSYSDRDRAIAAMLSFCVRRNRKLGREEPHWASEILANVPTRAMHSQMKKAETWLLRRIETGHDALYLHMNLQTATAYAPVPPAIQHQTRSALMRQGMTMAQAARHTMTRTATATKPLTLNALAKRRPSRYKIDWWRPKVLNIAAALAQHEMEHPTARQYGIIDWLLASDQWVASVVDASERHVEHWRTYGHLLPAPLAGLTRTEFVRLTLS